MSRIAEMEFRGEWFNIIGGAATVTVTDGILKCISNSTDSASKRIYKAVTGGDKISIEVFARSKNGTSHIFIDYPYTGGNVSPVIVEENDEFKKYVLTWVVPFGETENILSVGLGNFATDAAEAEFFAPIIKINGDITPAIVTEEWTDLPLLNGWLEFDASLKPQYMKDVAGTVHVRGSVKSGTIDTTIGTLPVGYRPKATTDLPGISNNSFARLVIESSGAVQPKTGSNLWFAINCSFRPV